MSGLFTLCYRKDPFARNWDCEYGFESVSQVDYRANEIREKNPTAVTTFMPFSSYTPVFVQREIIRYNFTPSIGICRRSPRNMSD